MKLSILTTALTTTAALTVALAPLQASSPEQARSLVLQVKGTAIGEIRDIDTDGDGILDTQANCFEVGLYDPRTGRQIGTATDCLSEVGVVIDDDPASAPLGWNLALTGTTFFHLPGGTLVTQGLTSVRPALHPTSRGDRIFTHVTGANGDGGIQYGTGRFGNAFGDARLSGLVDLAKLGTDGEITFDCLFVVDLRM